MIERPTYVEKLISKQWNGRVKIITGIRRSGKSTLLFDIYKEYLLNSGVSKSEICDILQAVSPTTVESVLGKMVKTGSVVKLGQARATKYVNAKYLKKE